MTSKPLINRRTFLKKSLQYVLGFIGSVGLPSVYAYQVEPYWIQTKHIDISLPRLPEAFRGFRICQFSDIHLGYHFGLENLSSLVEQIQTVHADVICFTGDLFDRETVDVSETARHFSQLNAPYGKIAVLGNHDNWGNREAVNRVLKTADFQVLHNTHVPLRKEGEVLFLAGVDDPWVGKPDITSALRGIPEESCTILLAHEPDFADEYSRYPIDLQLSGHSHGGQIQLPWVGPLYTPPHSSKYPDGLYTVQNRRLQVYTTRGIGMTRAPVRFNCRPELTVITLNP
ncbi:metallophosphoesterase [Salinithrix halophila]|uniref:Metallophosphoesterase n=1 Tax=Salinithrix halophila TaxID=1485204 RepID=A0ABV8JAR6_9BACL